MAPPADAHTHTHTLPDTHLIIQPDRRGEQRAAALSGEEMCAAAAEVVVICAQVKHVEASALDSSRLQSVVSSADQSAPRSPVWRLKSEARQTGECCLSTAAQ